MKTIILLILLTMPLFTPVHENSGKTHSEGSTGFCYGWKKADTGMRICYINRERTLCKTLIYSHDVWHESEPYLCEEGEPAG